MGTIRDFKMKRLMHRLATSLNAAGNYGNPLQILLSRLVRKPDDIVWVQDRDSGVRCSCSLASHHMFGDVWFAHVYDVRGVPIRSGDLVIDIGANHGFFTCYAACKGARVIAFEPVPKLYERAVANVRQNGFAERVTVVPCAVGGLRREVEMRVSASLGGGESSIVNEFSRNNKIPIEETIRVPCKTLADIFEEYSISSIRMCKLDVEGAEFEILKSLGPNHIEKIQSIAMEYHYGAYPIQELFKMLEGWGTHNISLMDQREFAGDILRCTARGLLPGSPR
jgi:FkbM family methyltransferase